MVVNVHNSHAHLVTIWRIFARLFFNIFSVLLLARRIDELPRFLNASQNNNNNKTNYSNANKDTKEMLALVGSINSNGEEIHRCSGTMLECALKLVKWCTCCLSICATDTFRFPLRTWINWNSQSIFFFSLAGEFLSRHILRRKPNRLWKLICSIWNEF